MISGISIVADLEAEQQKPDDEKDFGKIAGLQNVNSLQLWVDATVLTRLLCSTLQKLCRVILVQQKRWSSVSSKARLKN